MLKQILDHFQITKTGSCVQIVCVFILWLRRSSGLGTTAEDIVERKGTLIDHGEWGRKVLKEQRANRGEMTQGKRGKVKTN